MIPIRMKEIGSKRRDLEGALDYQFRCASVVGLERQYQFHPTRKWRFDFAIPSRHVAMEVEGLVYKGKGKDTTLHGRHVSVAGIHGDIEKYNEAALLGWKVLRATDKHIKSGQALHWMLRAIGRLDA